MTSYPQNRKYVIIPTNKADKAIDDFSKIARKNIAADFIIWDFRENDPQLANLQKIEKVKIMTHEEAIKLMATEKWNKPDKEK